MKKYDSYKDSGVEWIGEIPSHWEVKKVKHSFIFKTGFTPPSGKSEYYDNGTHIWINISDLQKKEVYDSEKKITDKAIEVFRPEIIPAGSLLYSFKLSVGRVGFNTTDCYTNEAIFSIAPNNSINLGFFYYSLPKQIIKNANVNIYGAKILNQELIKDAKIIVPPSEEQISIATYLDRKTAEIDSLIADQEQLLELYEEEKTAIIHDLVTGKIVFDGNKWTAPKKVKDSGIEWLGEVPEEWEVKKLKYVAYFQRGHDLSSTNFIKGDIPVYGSNGIIGYHNEGTTVGPGITIGRSGSVGEVNFVSQSSFWAHNTSLFLLKNFNNNIQYLYHMLKLLDLKSYAAGTAVGSLNRNNIHEIYVSVPSTETQQLIVSKIENELSVIDAKIDKSERSIELLKEYREALISEVVTGKVKIENDK